MRYSILLFIVFFCPALDVWADAVIERVKGEVKIRRGLEERWIDAHRGDELQDIDTILSKEGHVELRLKDGSVFKMGSHSILDIGDLRAISRQEMFLFIMSQKVQKMTPRKSRSTLHVENVSSVHGEKKSTAAPAAHAPAAPKWELAFNAACAMYEQNYYPNTVIKLHKILNRYPDMDDCGKVYLVLGKSFEALDEPGQALDRYRRAMEIAAQCEDETVVNEAEKAIRRLSD